MDTKLAPVSPVRTRMSIGRDLRDGEVYAEEYGRQIKGQMSLELEQGPSGMVMGAGTDAADDKVVDLRKAAL